MVIQRRSTLQRGREADPQANLVGLLSARQVCLGHLSVASIADQELCAGISQYIWVCSRTSIPRVRKADLVSSGRPIMVNRCDFDTPLMEVTQVDENETWQPLPQDPSYNANYPAAAERTMSCFRASCMLGMLLLLSHEAAY
jgi:hypothetical protein